MRIKNMIKKATVAALTAVMIFAPIVNVKASSSDVIDTSKTGSITIHKYDMTAAKQRGVNLDNFTSTGKQDTAAEAALEKYAIKGVEFSYLRVGDVEQQSENGKIQMIYELPTALQQILGLVPSDAAKTKEETIAPTGHTKTEIRNKKAATCKEEGYTGDTYCVTCGKKLASGETIAKTDHDWTITETEATCEHDGMKTYTCDICGTTKSEPIKASGHKFGAWTTTKEADVFSKEEQKRTCSICGKTETRTIGDKLKATISTNAASLKLKKKQSTTKFTVTGLAKGDYVTSITSSNKKIVTVTGNQNGTCKIKAGSKTGKATITIKLASGLTKQIKVSVQKKAVTCSKIKNVPKTIKLKKKQTYQLKPMIEPITCTDKAKYKSSNKKTAKVTKSGKITAVKKGKTKVTVVVDKKKFVCTVNIR